MFFTIKEQIRDLLEKASEETISANDIKDSDIADFSSSIAFRLAKKRKANPADIATAIAENINPEGAIERIEANSGYVNFYLDYKRLCPELLKEINSKKDSYGLREPNGVRMILEHTSINPSGPVHIGRLRNSLIGDCIRRLLVANGYDVETHYYVNDIGKQIAIIAQGILEGVLPDPDAAKKYSDYAQKEDFEVFFEYVSANRRFEDDPKFAQRVQENILLAESGNQKALDSITQVARKCLTGQKKVFDRLGITFDVFDFESDCIKDGSVSQVIDFIRESEYAEENENGFGVDLSSFGLSKRGGLSILTRKDKTTVYLARDIAYHLKKIGLGDRLLNVLGEDHKFEFKELKTILEKIYGKDCRMDVVHYSFVSFEGVELSTRKGQTAPVDLLIDESIKKAETEIEQRGIAKKEAAPSIGIGAIKYHILKTAPLKQIAFKWNEALSFDGESAPYIQYAYARSKSILARSPHELRDVEGNIELEDYELTLIKQLMRYTSAIESAGTGFKPNLMAAYLYELASVFNRFYKSCKVISEDEQKMNMRLGLVSATAQVIKNGLGLLGIDAPERM